ncbi:MAG: putative ribosomal protein L27A [Streblomastix strix]|uniref:Putative ribosomal protein L27A n=1 Tax=Streblomastix strix TaxID=222440 RepID=A0A5J4VK52_9EUKA|nr:MAG: putative ribosomal protein L27A [Streblomastix strix]
MVTRLKQTRKKRGQQCMGYGRVGKHRKHPSGRGFAGAFAHHRTLFSRYHPGYVGKFGQRHIRLLKTRLWRPAINIDKLWSLVSEQKRKNIPEGKMPVIDCMRAGYYKVLGTGKLPKIPVCIRAKFFSSIAKKKILAVGGKVEQIFYKKRLVRHQTRPKKPASDGPAEAKPKGK